MQQKSNLKLLEYTVNWNSNIQNKLGDFLPGESMIYWE